MLEFIVFLPLFTALAILVGAPARYTALSGAIVNTVAALLVATRLPLNVEAPGATFMASSRRMLEKPELNLSFAVDGMSLVLVLLTVIVTFAAILASPPESKIKGKGMVKLYYVSSLLISAGALGAFLSTDLFFFYAFHELALIPTFLMIGLLGHGAERKRIAWTITIYLGVGSLVLLAGLLALFFAFGGQTFSFDALYGMAENSNPIAPETQRTLFLLLLIGFGILISLFPFHSWAPPAYAAAPTPVAMLHAGVLKKFGLYGLIRLALPLLPEGAAYWQHLILVLLLGNILVIGLVTIAQRRLDTMLGYSSVMHMGYVFLGIASGNVIGLNGAILLMFAHGISIALLFALAGKLRDRVGSLEFDALHGGFASKMPVMGVLFGFAAFASAGLPGFANFASEVLVFFGGFQPFQENPDAGLGLLQWTVILSLWGVVISAVYMLRAYRRIFQGPLIDSDSKAGFEDLSPGERVPVVLLLAVLMITGFFPGILLKYLAPTLDALTLFGG